MYLRFTITFIPNVNHFRPWRLFKKSKVSLWRNSLNRILQPSEHNRRVVWDEQIQLSVKEKKKHWSNTWKGEKHISLYLCKRWRSTDLRYSQGGGEISPVRGADTPQQMSLAFYGIRSDPEIGGSPRIYWSFSFPSDIDKWVCTQSNSLFRVLIFFFVTFLQVCFVFFFPYSFLFRMIFFIVIVIVFFFLISIRSQEQPRLQLFSSLHFLLGSRLLLLCFVHIQARLPLRFFDIIFFPYR